MLTKERHANTQKYTRPHVFETKLFPCERIYFVHVSRSETIADYFG